MLHAEFACWMSINNAQQIHKRVAPSSEAPQSAVMAYLHLSIPPNLYLAALSVAD